MARTVIDPVTRIEGHMRVECEIKDNEVVDAWVSGSLYRGMETVLLDRSPEDAFYVSQRICGVCPISHSHASAQATEAALGITIPEGGRLVRNILECAQYLHSHILWFYNLTGEPWYQFTIPLVNKGEIAGSLEIPREVTYNKATLKIQIIHSPQ